MILSSLKNYKRVAALSPAIQQVLDYVSQHDLSQVPAGRITLDGSNVFINVNDAELCAQEEQKLEIHRQYIDIHFPLSGDEVVGWSDISDLTTESLAPFDCENDFALFAEPAQTYFTAHPGDFYIMYPEDAHAPIIGKGKLRKLVAKIKIEE